MYKIIEKKYSFLFFYYNHGALINTRIGKICVPRVTTVEEYANATVSQLYRYYYSRVNKTFRYGFKSICSDKHCNNKYNILKMDLNVCFAFDKSKLRYWKNCARTIYFVFHTLVEII